MFDQAVLEQINLLARFDDHSMQSGIKVHSNAGDAVVQAAQSLFNKGLITQVDGGYLTDLGKEASAHIQHLAGILAAN